MDAAHSGGLLARLHLSSDLAFDHDDSDEDDGGPTQWSTGASRIGSHETLAQMVDRLERQNDELKADLDDEHRALRLMTAELEREERAIRQMCLELEELENHHCPVCQAMVPNTEIDRHMESCLHSLALHVADKVRKTHAAELAWRDTVDRSLQPLHEYDLWWLDGPTSAMRVTLAAREKGVLLLHAANASTHYGPALKEIERWSYKRILQVSIVDDTLTLRVQPRTPLQPDTWIFQSAPNECEMIAAQISRAAELALLQQQVSGQQDSMYALCSQESPGRGKVLSAAFSEKERHDDGFGNAHQQESVATVSGGSRSSRGRLSNQRRSPSPVYDLGPLGTPPLGFGTRSTQSLG